MIFLHFPTLLKYSNGSAWIREMISTNTFAFTLLISNISSFVRSIIQSLHKRWNSACDPLIWTCASSQVAFQPRLCLSVHLFVSPPDHPQAHLRNQGSRVVSLSDNTHKLSTKGWTTLFRARLMRSGALASTSRSWGTRFHVQLLANNQFLIMWTHFRLTAAGHFFHSATERRKLTNMEVWRM